MGARVSASLRSSCARSQTFGGPKLQDLYVTSAFIELSEQARCADENRHAGCVFRVTGHGATGLPPHTFGARTIVGQAEVT